MGVLSRSPSKHEDSDIGPYFCCLLPFFVSGTQAKDGHIMRFGRSAQDQSDKRAGGSIMRFGRSGKDHIMRFGRSDPEQSEEKRQLMRFGRSVMNQNDMFMRALRQAGSSDMFMRALRSNDALTRGQRSSDMFMRALREDPSLM